MLSVPLPEYPTSRDDVVLHDPALRLAVPVDPIFVPSQKALLRSVPPAIFKEPVPDHPTYVSPLVEKVPPEITAAPCDVDP